MLPSVSVVIVVGETPPAPALLSALTGRLDGLFTDFEFILVANDVSEPVSLVLKSLVEQLPDSLAVFLGERVHGDMARLVGIDHAVSDHVLFVTPTNAEIAHLDDLAAPLTAGMDLVVTDAPGVPDRGLLFAVFRKLFRWTTGKTFEGSRPAFRIMSRAAALYVSSRADGEVLIRARQLGSGFPAASITVPGIAPTRSPGGTLVGDIARGLRLITTSSTKLLRVSAYLGVVGGIASVIYAGYVLAVYALVADVQPGWTTTSLQLSGILFFFSLQFLLLSEHVIQIAASNPGGNRRHIVIRELRSRLSRRSARLNVVDQEGRFQLGAPPHLSDPAHLSEPAR